MIKTLLSENKKIEVLPIGLGANAIGGYNIFNNIEDDKGKKTLHHALEKGINFIDTAFRYGNGHSEELIGEVLKEHNREQVVIATKGAHRLTSNGIIMDGSPAYLRETLENSLRRLKTDYIDLFYLHYPDKTIPISESIGALETFRQEGKIRYIGVSNVTLAQLKEANQNHSINALQYRYSLIERDAEDQLLPYCIEHNISFIPYGPLSYGLLGGKYTPDTVFQGNDWRARLDVLKGKQFIHNLQRVEHLKIIANKKNTSTAALSLAWLLSQRGIDIVIPGAKSPEQVSDHLLALEISLTNQDLDEINSIFNDSIYSKK